MKTIWKVGQRVKYKLRDGDLICVVKKTTPYNEKNKSCYVELLVEKTGETIYSAWDKNLISLE